MRLNLTRNINNQSFIQTYDVDNCENLLEAFEEIKKEKDATLTYRCGCKSGICGSCSVRVNGVEKLACKTKINENDLIEPIKNTKIIKDFVVDIEFQERLLKNTETYLHNFNSIEITKNDESLIDRQSNCILCQSCYSSCPVYEVNSEFIGPYTLTRALRYVNDKKEDDASSILSNIQNNGIWDCTLCSNCTMVCPQFIDPKSDIMALRMKSVQNGFEDKSFSSFNTGFDTGFDPLGGFNPNGF